MLSKKFFSIMLDTVSVLSLSGMVLGASLITPSKAMEVEAQQGTSNKRKRSTSNSQAPRAKRSKTNISSTPFLIKKEPIHSRGLLTQQDLEQKVQLVNPNNGTKNCLKCGVSGYLMLKYQLSIPKRVNTKGPTNDNYWINRNGRDIDLIDFQQASLLPSGKIQLTDSKESWTEEFTIEDSHPITFKEKSIEEFHDLLKMME